MIPHHENVFSCTSVRQAVPSNTLLI